MFMVSRFPSEEGASAVIVALSLLFLFAASAIAIDLGSAWQTKRDLVVDTDAGALSAARLAATDGCDPAAPIVQVAVDFMSANLGEGLTASDIALDCMAPADATQPNTVSVSLTREATQTLSQTLGVDSIDVYSASTATFNGFKAGDMRPIALCNVDPVIADYVPPGASGTLPAENLIVSMGKTWTDPNCGGGTGNWGYLCFDQTGCSNGDIQTLMEHGHANAVDLGTSNAGAPHPYSPPPGGTDEDCKLGSGTSTDWCEIRPGQAFTDNTPEKAILDSLVNTSFSVLVSDCIGKLSPTNTCEAGSSSATFVHPYAIGYVTMHAWCSAKNNESQSDWHPSDAGFSNAQCHNAATGNNDLVLALTLHGVGVEGTPKRFFNFEDPAVNLCGVDHDTVDNRCVRP